MNTKSTSHPTRASGARSRRPLTCVHLHERFHLLSAKKDDGPTTMGWGKRIYETLIQSAPAPTCLRTAFTHSTSPSTNCAPVTPSTPSWCNRSWLFGPVQGRRSRAQPPVWPTIVPQRRGLNRELTIASARDDGAVCAEISGARDERVWAGKALAQLDVGVFRAFGS